MFRTNKKATKMNILSLYIFFVGDADRGKRLQEIVKSYDLKFHNEIEIRPAQIICANFIPDLVILDNFPESKITRSAFYQFRHNKDVRFISLNDSPYAIKYLHINALSFIQMINRDPKPKQFINAILDMIKSKHGLHSQYSGVVNFERNTEGCKSINLSYSCGNTTC